MKIDCFKMSKRFEIALEWPANKIDLHGDYVAISYKPLKGKSAISNKFIDLYNKHSGLII